MTSKTEAVDAYLDVQNPERQAALQAVRELIFEAVPEIRETMRYRMPTYELDEVVVAFASQKHYMSLYLDTELVEKYGGELAGLDCGKSCVRFKRIDDLPLDTVRAILVETVEKQSGG
jgi:uncharacterized protein YdhG (YjbR/CyaY superfamily)